MPIGMTRLTLRLFGPPSVEVDGQEARISRRKALALLAYLAVTGQSHTRDALATLLWPEQDQTRARNSLRSALVSLRRALGDDWLDADRESVGLREGVGPSTGSGCGFWLDLAKFQGKLEECHTHGHAPEQACPACLPLLTEAAELYRGDFMAGFTLPDSPEFDEWQYYQSEGLRRELAGALERLANGHAAQGEYEAAIKHARRWVALDPLNEPAHRILMRLYAWSGQRAAALEQYSACERVLAEEMGVPPDDETTQLYRAILDKAEGPAPVRRATAAAKHNLPAQLTSFVGREGEIAAVKELLERVRLLTLTGPPGTGKTRLGLQVAADVLDQYADGVIFVELAPISDPGLVASSIADVFGVSETSEQPLLTTLKTYLRERKLLLLLDNFEQIIDAAPLVSELLSAAPDTKALVTSREVLHVYGEQEYPVPPLTLPDPECTEPLRLLSQYEAVDLFTQRAQAVKPDFALSAEDACAVAEICVRLDGLPLAIELAAARSKLLTPRVMLKRLDSRQGALTEGPRDLPARQRTLRAAIDWSYDLLDPDEQRLFARLSVFQGGRSVEAVEAVCSHGLANDVSRGLESLLNKSLLRQDTGSDGEPRFVMLEMLHEYARERLEESGEAVGVRRRHAGCFVALAERAAPELLGPEQVRWSLHLKDEQENLRAALAWSLGSGDAELGLRLAGALCDFWYYSGHSAEGLAWTKRALESAKDAPPADRARALNTAGRLAWDQGDFESGKAYNREALALYQALGDKNGAAWALNWLGSHALASPGECREGIRLCEEALALFREMDDKSGLSHALNNLGELARMAGDYERAGAAYQEVIDILRKQGNRLREAVSRGNLSYVAYHQGDYEQAQAHILEAFALLPKVHDTYYLTHGLSTLAGPVAALGYPEKAARLLGASEALLEKMGLGLQAGDRFEIERYVAAVREQLDDVTFEAAWAEGRAMTFEEAIAYAQGGDIG